MNTPADNRVAVSGRELETIRRRIARTSSGVNASYGWSVDDTTSNQIVDLFSRLELRQGFRLVTTAWRERVGGNGWTFAVPTEAPPLDPQAFDADRAQPFDPLESPAGALPHVMDAIEGDGSLKSLVQASILMRELHELGAWWHGISWSQHELLDGKDRPNLLSDALNWQKDEEADRTPLAQFTPNGATVTFWTSSMLGQASVYRHTDEFEGSSLQPTDTREEVVAKGPGGMVF